MSNKQAHVFFQGRGSQQLMNDIVRALHPEYLGMPGVTLHSHDVNHWPTDIFSYALALLLAEGHISQSLSSESLASQLKQQNGSAHGQKFFLLTFGL